MGQWKLASRGVIDSKNQIENKKKFQVQHGGNQPLVESNTPKIKLKIRNFFKSNTLENSLSLSQTLQNKIENPKHFQVQHNGNHPLVESKTPKIKIKTKKNFKSNTV